MKQIEAEIIQQFQKEAAELRATMGVLQIRCTQAETRERALSAELAKTNDALNLANNELAKIRMAESKHNKP